jgi:hypothetical protein
MDVFDHHDCGSQRTAHHRQKSGEDVMAFAGPKNLLEIGFVTSHIPYRPEGARSHQVIAAAP